MNVTRLEDVETVEAVSGAHLSQLGGGDEINVQHFALDPGATVPEHAHESHEQVSFLYEGELVFVVEDGEVTARAGDACVLARGEAHAVENRGDVPARGIDLYSPPRPDPDWIDG